MDAQSRLQAGAPNGGRFEGSDRIRPHSNPPTAIKYNEYCQSIIKNRLYSRVAGRDFPALHRVALAGGGRRPQVAATNQR